MLLFLLIFLTLALIVYLTRVIQLEGNPPNSFVVFPLVLAILVTGVFEFHWQNGETKGSRIVTYVSGVTSSDLHCQRLTAAFYDYNPEQKGWVDEKNPKTVNMKYQECMSLANWFIADQETEPATSHQAFTLHLLIFEANKVKNPSITDAQAECNATAQYVEVAKYAGASPQEATRMLDLYKSEWYPYLPKELKQGCA